MGLFMIILILVVVLIIPNIKIVPQAKAYVIERLGSYNHYHRNKALQQLIEHINQQ